MLKNKATRKLEEVLQSASDRLFPAEAGKRKVYLDSRSSDGDTALHVFIWANETKKAVFLIENEINIDAIGDMGETPLHAALHQKNITVIKALLHANTRTDIKPDFGKTAKDLAQENGISLEEHATLDYPERLKVDRYFDQNGNIIFTERFLIRNGFCCGLGCKHCPYFPKHQAGNKQLSDNLKIYINI